jgi:hypothetical protein
MKTFIINFLITVPVVFIVVTVITFLYNLIFHGIGIAEWETALKFALIFGIAFPLIKVIERRKKEK